MMRTRTSKWRATVGGAAAAMLGASPAFAASTPAGTTITNTAIIDFQAGGVGQTAATASDSFIVDRKINLSLTEVGNVTTSVAPGQTSAVTAFTVTNTSNAPLDFALAVTQLAGGTAAHGGTDDFDVSNVLIYGDTNTNGVYDAGTDTLITYLDEVAADAARTVFVVADVALNRSDDDVAGVRLTATAAEATAAGSLGTTVTQTSGPDTAGVDTVFADTNTSGNTARDGAHFGGDDYTVLAARLTLSKISRPISDPFNGITNSKMIPGATIEYCVQIRNSSGAATASNVDVLDTLPLDTTYDPAFGILVNGTVSGTTCSGGAAGGSYDAGTRTISASVTNIAAGSSRAVRFRGTVN